MLLVKKAVYKIDIIKLIDFLFFQLEELWNTNENHGNFSVIRLSPQHVHRIKRSSQYRFLTENLANWIQNGFSSTIKSSQTVYPSLLVADYRHDMYQPLNRIYQFLESLIKLAPIRVFDVGLTHEGRKIKAVEYRGNVNDNRLVWIDATIHAREWISPATAIFLLEKLILSKAKVNVLMIPILNPDGYEYTWNVDRLWRKNRRISSTSRYMNDDTCNGVDLNRNFDSHFNGEGSSDDHCSQLYQGPEPFSEPETRAMANLIWSMRKNIVLSISIHSFSQIWTCPYAHSNHPSAHIRTHMNILNSIHDSVYAVNGVSYTVGPLSSVLYVGSGFSMDWIYDKVGIVHSYLVELRDKGMYGFLLPAEQIIPTALETWAGVKTAIEKVINVHIK